MYSCVSLLKATLPTIATVSAPSLSKWVSRATEEFPSQFFLKGDPGAWMCGNTYIGSMISSSFTASFLFFCGEFSHDPENGACLSERLRPLYKKNFQGQRETCDSCDVIVSGQCFSSLVFIAFKLWLKRWIGRWFVSLAFHWYSRLGKGKSSWLEYHLMDLFAPGNGSTGWGKGAYAVFDVGSECHSDAVKTCSKERSSHPTILTASLYCHPSLHRHGGRNHLAFKIKETQLWAVSSSQGC